MDESPLDTLEGVASLFEQEEREEWYFSLEERNSMDDRMQATSASQQRYFCLYCHTLLPEEPEEIRRVFAHAGMKPTIWIGYRCANPACQEKNFVLYAPLHAGQKG
jgi:RNA-binding protein YlmH